MTTDQNVPDLGATYLNDIYAIAFSERRRGFDNLNAANIEADFEAYRAYELGWYRDLTEAEFEALLREQESLGMQSANGQDLPRHEKRLQVLDAIFEAGGWTIDMDSGKPVRKEHVDATWNESDGQGA